MAQTSGIGAAAGGGAKRADDKRVAVSWHEDDRWLFRRLGLIAPDRLSTVERMIFEETVIPGTKGARVQLDILACGRLTATKFFGLKITEPCGTRWGFVAAVEHLREAWPLVEMLACGAVISVEQVRALAAANGPLVKFGPGGDFTRDINPEDIRLRRQAAGGAA